MSPRDQPSALGGVGPGGGVEDASRPERAAGGVANQKAIDALAAIKATTVKPMR